MPRDLHTEEVKRDMLEAYITQGKNARRAANYYGQRHPDKRLPSYITFFRVYQRFVTTGSILHHPQHVPRRSRHRTFDIELEVLLFTIENPTSSLRQAGRVLGIPKDNIRRIRMEYNMFPYRSHVVHGLLPNDLQRRLVFLATMDGLISDMPDIL
ncbi:UNVERIFIED_CONTAM: hypothetical protein RMT77_011495 [Armadillidium vulgare]